MSELTETNTAVHSSPGTADLWWRRG